MNYHYYLVINSNSGSGRGTQIGKELTALMDEKGLNYSASFTQYAGQEIEIVKELAANTLVAWEEDKEYETFPLLLVVGGDGTLNQVMNALHDFSKDIPLAFIPGGSGNDFARAVGITRGNTKEALEQILKADQPQKINVLKYYESNKQIEGTFVNNFGIGIDASVVHATNDSATKATLNKYHLGSLAYVLSVLKVLFTQKTFTVTVTLKNGETKTFDKAFLATTTNHAYFGGGVAIAPSADPRKEDMYFVLAEKTSWPRLFSLIFALSKGKHFEKEDFHHFVSDEIILVTTTEQYGQVDGETIDKQEFNLKFQAGTRYIWF